MIFIGVLGILLSFWQLSRASEKKEFLEKSYLRGKEKTTLNTDNVPVNLLNIESWDQRKLVVAGYWLPNSTIYLDNRSFESKPGVHVISAFQLENQESLIWVNRGWAPKLPGKIFSNKEFIEGTSFLPVQSNILTTLEGVAHIDLMKRIELTSDKLILRDGSLWQNLNWNALHLKLSDTSTSSFTKVWPFILWQTSNSEDKLIRSLPKVKVDVNKHLGYAVQWLLLGMVSFFFAIRLGRKKD